MKRVRWTRTIIVEGSEVWVDLVKKHAYMYAEGERYLGGNTRIGRNIIKCTDVDFEVVPAQPITGDDTVAKESELEKRSPVTCYVSDCEEINRRDIQK